METTMRQNIFAFIFFIIFLFIYWRTISRPTFLFPKFHPHYSTKKLLAEEKNALK